MTVLAAILYQSGPPSASKKFRTFTDSTCTHSPTSLSKNHGCSVVVAMVVVVEDVVVLVVVVLVEVLVVDSTVALQFFSMK